MADVGENGDFYDKWEQVMWSKCHGDDNKLIEHIWRDEKLYLPSGHETKLVNRYGESWRIPQNNKGVMPHKHVL